MNANLTCRVDEYQESPEGNETGCDLDEEEVQQPVFGIGGGWRPWEITQIL